MPCIALHYYLTLPYTTLHCLALPYIALHYLIWHTSIYHSIPLHANTFLYPALHYMPWHTLRTIYIRLHTVHNLHKFTYIPYLTLHCSALHAPTPLAVANLDPASTCRWAPSWPALRDVCGKARRESGSKPGKHGKHGIFMGFSVWDFLS